MHTGERRSVSDHRTRLRHSARRRVFPAMMAWSGVGAAATFPELALGAATDAPAAGPSAALFALSILLAVIAAFFLITVVVIFSLAAKVRKTFWTPAATGNDPAWRSYLMQLPLGIPEGTIRALVSLFVIVFGFLVLVMQNQLGITNGDVIAGFVGIVITFYFTARSGDQVQKAADAAKSAADNAQAAVARTETAAENVHSVVNRAISTVQSAAVQAVSATQTAPPSRMLQPSGAISTAQAKLRDIRDALQSVRALASAVAGLKSGTSVLSDAAGMIAKADTVLATIDPLLSGSPDARSLDNVVKSASSALDALQNAGLPGAFAGAIATFKATLGVASPVLAGIAGGPVGLVAGLVLGGLEIAQKQQQLAAWKTALLAKPFDPELMKFMSAATADGTVAAEALKISPLMMARIGAGDPARATGLMRAVLRRGEDGGLAGAADLATELWKPGAELGLHEAFGSEEELEEALVEYRASVVFGEARERIEGSVRLPALDGAPEQSVALGELADRALLARKDPRAAAEVDRLVYLSEALGQLAMSAGELGPMIVAALKVGRSLAETARQNTDPSRTEPASSVS